MADYTYIVTVSGAKYYIDGELQSEVYLGHDLTYRFDTSDSSCSGHALAFSTTEDGTNYPTGVSTNGTAGSSGAYTEIAVTSSTPATLYYRSASATDYGAKITTTANTYVPSTNLALPIPVAGDAQDRWASHLNSSLRKIDTKIPQELKTTSSPSFTAINADTINEKTTSGGITVADATTFSEGITAASVFPAGHVLNSITSGVVDIGNVNHANGYRHNDASVTLTRRASNSTFIIWVNINMSGTSTAGHFRLGYTLGVGSLSTTYIGQDDDTGEMDDVNWRNSTVIYKNTTSGTVNDVVYFGTSTKSNSSVRYVRAPSITVQEIAS